MSARGCNPGNCLELQEARKENQGIKSSLNLTATLHKRQNFFLYPLFTKDSWKHFDWVNDHEIRERVDKFSSVDCGGTPKEVWEEYWADFLFVYMEFPKLHQPALERQRIESHLKLATYQTRYFGLKCHPCSIV